MTVIEPDRLRRPVIEERVLDGGVSPAWAGLGIGIALASAPGPVQAILLAESHRGGMARGFRVMAGSIVTFGLLLVGAALGLTVTTPRGVTLRFLQAAGGAFLIWLAADAFRDRRPADDAAPGRRGSPPAVRGAVAVLLNPGMWLFLGTVASSLISSAAQDGRMTSSLLAALGLLAGCALGDGVVVVVGGLGLRRAGERAGMWVRRGLAIVLATLGLWLLVEGWVS